MRSDVLEMRDQIPMNDMYPPAVHILGAPKCGTTALAGYLSDHPAIAFSRPKETHHYSTDLSGIARSHDDDSYKALFTPTADTQLLMEGSVWYLYSPTAVPAILKDRPDAKFIVMLRDPVKMIPSLHLQLLNALDEDVTDLRTAWNLSDKRALGEAIPKSCRAPSTLLYKKTAAYGEMLERLFALVPKERCKIFFQEEMSRDTQRVYQQTLDFIGLDDDGRDDFPRINVATNNKSRALQYLIARGKPLRQLVSTPIKKLTGKSSLGVLQGMKKWNDVEAGPLDTPEDLKDEIAAHYAPDMARLSSLLDRDLTELGWRTKA